jgi:hypothetical protein
MVNTTIKYIVYNHSGGGVRHHHFSTSNDIIAEADGHASPGDTLNALGFPSQIFNGHTLPFAFMSVHGAADGNHLYTSPGNQSVSVGSSDVQILVVYGPVGGSNGTPGIWVDAFNVNAGDFSDSDFIQVLTPPNPPDTLDNAKTAYANAEGVVPSITPEHLRAQSTVDGAPFLELKKIVPVESLLSSTDFNLAQNESGEIWFAFYQTVPPGPGIFRLHEKIIALVDTWVTDDYCGTPHPHHFGPHGMPDFRIKIAEMGKLKLSATQKEQLAGYMKEYPAIAGEAYAAMTKVTDMLGAISKLLSGKQVR